MEQTAAIVGTISSVTRESAESIGTSVNSMVSRFAKITETGMNSIFEDEDGAQVAVNDIAEALSTVGIELYNTNEGFADMWDVLVDLDGQWDDLDDATRNYIATQFAGTRNLNRFIVMMEHFDEVLRLYEGSLNAAGLAGEKYAIWQESVAAAQDNLSGSLENLYATFMNGGMVQDFYNLLAGIVDLITGGLNTGIGKLILGATAIFAVIGGGKAIF